MLLPATLSLLMVSTVKPEQQRYLSTEDFNVSPIEGVEVEEEPKEFPFSK